MRVVERSKGKERDETEVLGGKWRSSTEEEEETLKYVRAVNRRPVGCLLYWQNLFLETVTNIGGKERRSEGSSHPLWHTTSRRKDRKENFRNTRQS